MNSRLRIFALATATLTWLVSATSAFCTAWTDYGAVPAIMKPSVDKSDADKRLDFHTDLFTGRFTYKVPIDIPPGRQGSEPGINLRYNSSFGNGWCGVGWGLDMGYVQRETRYGVHLAGGSYNDADGFIYSFQGKSGRLVSVGNGIYYPEINTDFLKFTYANGYWTVTDRDGTKYTFGDTANSPLSRIATSYGTFSWKLSNVTDANGNTTVVTYQAPANGQIYLSQISYNGNVNTPTISANCTVTFALQSRSDVPNSCVSGAEIDTGYLLHTITVNCNGSQVRQYVLGYSVSPSTGRSLLHTITEYGTDSSWQWPTMTFTYSQQLQEFLQTQDWAIVPQNTANLPDASGYCPSSAFAELIDVNGDGLPDWVTGPGPQDNSMLPPYTHFNVQLNTGTGFGPVQPWSSLSIEYPDGSWNWNAVNGYIFDATTGNKEQVTSLVDIDGDMLPDRVLRAYLLNTSSYTYDHFQVQANTGTGFGLEQSWWYVSSLGNSQFAKEFLTYPFLQTGDGEADLDLLIDMNGDGFADRVMIGSQSGQLDVQLNDKNGTFASPVGWTGVKATSGIYFYAPRDRSVLNLSGYSYIYSDLMDMNGDGLPDRVMQDGVQLNNGLYGFGGLTAWNYGGPPEEVYVPNGAYTIQLIDMNGDGLPDYVYSTSTGYYYVYFNTGKEFSGSSYGIWQNIDTGGDGTAGWSDLQSWDQYGTKVQFIDMNGDGLPDRVMREVNPVGTNRYLRVQLNAGPFPDLLVGVNNGFGGSVSVSYVPSTELDNSDGVRPRLPMPLYVVKSVQVNDGIRTANTFTYAYAGGLYDTYWREFRGFAEADETDSLGKTTATYFYQGGGLYSNIGGLYQDSRFKAGMPWLIMTYGSDGKLYGETLNVVDQVRVDPSGVYFPFVSKVFTFDLEPSISARDILTEYTYDVTADSLASSTGNLLQKSELGEVNNVTIDPNTGVTSFSDVPDTSVYTTYTYASIPANPDIVDRPETVTVSSDAGGANVLRETTYQYFDDTHGNLKQKSELMCPNTYAVTQYTYDNYGNVHTIVDPMLVQTTIDYDSASATFPIDKYFGSLSDNLVEHTQYDPRSGELSSRTDEAGMVTQNTYDGLLRLTETQISTVPNGTANLMREQYAYALAPVSNHKSKSYVETIKNNPPNGNHVTYTYLDGLGRPIQVRNQAETGQYRVTDTFYNARGQVEAQTFPIFENGSTYIAYSGTVQSSYTTYDPIGRTHIEYPVANAKISTGSLSKKPTPSTGDTTSAVGPVTLTYGDSASDNPWVISVSDARSKVHTYDLDAYGRTNQIIESTSQGPLTSKLTYDAVGDLTSIVDDHQNTITFYYDDLGNTVAMTDPDMGFWQWTYDLDSRLAVRTDSKGQTSKYYYDDPAGRITRREGYSKANQLLSQVDYLYDNNHGDSSYTVYPGQLYEVSDDEGWQKYSYDVRGRVTLSSRYLTKNGATYTIQYGYDDADRVQTITYPGSTPPVVTYSYDAGENLSQVKRTDANGADITYYTPSSFDAFDRVQGITFGNGAATTFTYYPISQRLEQIITTVPGGTTIQNLVNSYDGDGNVVGVTDGVSTHTGAASATMSSATYDDLNRLTSATWAGYGTKNYAYDSIGNITLNGESGNDAYGYGTARPHMAKSANGVSYTCDLNGNITSRGGQILTYDVNNHLAQVQASDGTTTSFGYDAAGQRLWEQTGAQSLKVWIGDVYEENDGKVLYNIMANGRRVCTFEPAAGGTTGYDPATQEFYYYHPDYLGSSSLLTERNGTEVQHYEYSAFGQGRYTESSTAFAVSHRFTGQILDPDTGLYYYNARYYDPELGRFLEPDTEIPDLFNPQSYNRYSYVLNNPLRHTDPSGHSDENTWSNVTAPPGDYGFKRVTFTTDIERSFVLKNGTQTSYSRESIYDPKKVRFDCYQAVTRYSNGGVTRRQITTTEIEQRERLNTLKGMAMFAAFDAGGELIGGEALAADMSLAAETTAPRVFYVTPRGVAVSSETLAGQGSSHLAGNFQGLAGATVDDVIARVPSDWTWGPQRSGQGIVFSDTAGFERIRMHGPSMNAPAGANSQMGWTLRVMDRAGNYFDDAGNLVPYRANEGHIPLSGNPNAP